MNRNFSRRAIGALLAGLTAMGTAHAADPPERADQGFSFFLGVGGQTTRYRESSELFPVNSEVRTKSSMLMTGALYALDSQWLFSLDSEQTFYPSKAIETWTSTASSINGITLTTPVLQTNRATLSRSQIQFLAHYRLHEEAFVVGGPSFRTQSFKRFAFVAGPDGAVSTTPGQTVEESMGEVLLNLGFALESEKVRGAGTHYGVRAVLGLPVWRRLENTTQPDLSFNGRRGFDASLEGRYSLAMTNDVHLGGWGRWSLSRRSSQSAANGTVELPTTKQDGWSYGVELLWKL
jgi:hypothetical protein